MQLHILQTASVQQQIDRQLEQAKQATVELNKAVDRYKDMMEGLNDA